MLSVAAQILLWLAAITLVITFAIFAVSALRLLHKPAYIIGVYLLSFANIVVVGELAGAAGRLNNRLFFLTAHAVLAATAYFVWRHAGTPHPLGPLQSLFRKHDHSQLSQLGVELYILGGVVIVVYLIGVYIILTEPQVIDDVLTTYLARVGYWLQNGSFDPWPTSVYNLPQLIWPHNASLQMLWCTLFWGSDQLAGFAQWLAAPVTLLSVYGLSLFLGANRSQSAFVAFLWALFPTVVFQSTQALTDLVATGLFTGCIYLLFLGLRTGYWQYLWLSGLALGLGIGTRLSILFTLPGILIAIILLIIQGNRRNNQLLARWGLAYVVGFVLFGLPSFLYNIVNFGHPFGSGDLVVYYTHTSDTLNIAGFILRGLVNTILVLLFALIDGFTPAVYQAVFSQTSLPPALYIDTVRVYGYAWYNLSGFLLVLLALVPNTIDALKNKKKYNLSLMIIALCYSGIILFSRQYTEAVARYLLLAVTLMIPLSANLIKSTRFKVAVILISSPMLVYTLLFNGVAPLIGDNAIGTLDRIERQTSVAPFDEPSYEAILRRTLDTVSEEDQLGIMLPNKFPQSPLFGENFTRTVIQYAEPYPECIDSDWLKHNDLDYLLIDREALPNVELSGDLEILTPGSQYLLVRAEETP